MLKRIAIKNYKSIIELDLTLKPFSVLFGPNSAGKSNFLDALQLLSRMATKTTLKEAFEPPYRGTPLESVSFVGKGLPALLGMEHAQFSFEIDVELSRNIVESVNRLIREMRSRKDPDNGSSPSKVNYVTRTKLRYALTVEITPRSGMLRVIDEYLTALNSRWEPISQPKPFIERKGNRIHLRMERQAHPTFYDTYLDYTIISRPLYPPHYPHIVAMRQELANWFLFYFEPRERMRAASPVKEVRNIGLMGEDLAAFLNTLKALDEKQFHAIERSIHMVIPSLTGIDVSVNALGEVELNLREGNYSVPARIVSEGTLRVLGLLAIGGMKNPPSLIAFEEPENGIHPRRIRAIAELLKTMSASGSTQLILTSHSPILADLIPVQNLFICTKKEGATIIRPFSTWGDLAKTDGIQKAIDEEEEAPVSERMLRGDFDA
ncbi:MAG: AAA family ATPase [Terriglobales bacterium]